MAKGRAPGKVIICGEHAVVHGSAAVAAAIGLYTQAEITSSDDDTQLHLLLVELGLDLSWPVERIQTILQLQEPDSTFVRPCNEELTTGLKKLVEECGIPSDIHSGFPSGVMAFLFLYTSIVGFKPGTVRVESEIPMSCGLGSSAALSVALASAFLAFNGQVGKLASEKTQTLVSGEEADLVNRWAFESEKIIHGKPSGIDNTVSTYGNIVKYKKNEITHLSDLPSLRILLTNTRVPRNTKQLVAGVGLLKDRHPKVMTLLFETVDAISEDFINVLGSSKNKTTKNGVPSHKTESENALEELFAINQALLEAMGVSHPTIKSICEISAKFNLRSKLTGAGGGGCVITFLPRDFPGEILKKAMAELSAAGFESFEAELGAQGAQVFV